MQDEATILEYGLKLGQKATIDRERVRVVSMINALDSWIKVVDYMLISDLAT
jgi:hypothetical protein